MATGILTGASHPIGGRERWRELFATIESRPGVYVVFATPEPVAPFNYYAGAGPLRGLGSSTVEAERAETIGDASQVWYVPYLEDLYDPEQRVRAWLRAGGFQEGPSLQEGSIIALPFSRPATDRP